MKKFFFFSWFKWSDELNPGKGPTPSDEIPEIQYPYEYERDSIDGSEFLDDNFRMYEQSFDTMRVNPISSSDAVRVNSFD